MIKYLLILILPVLILAKNEDKIISLKLVNEEIVIDGIIDEVWSKADSATNFFQLMPFYAKSPTRKTVAKVLTSQDYLYCMIISYDDINNLEVQTGKTDEFSGDAVSFMIDTFGDKRTAYKFVVSASGVRSDCRLLDDARNRDYSWDGIWFADSEVYDWGYVVEIKIPYKSIQYDKNLTEWGLDFDRWIPNNSEDLYWCTYEQSEGQRISKFGKLLLGDFKPQSSGLNLEIYPVGISKLTLNEKDEYDLDGNAGFDIFYNPSPKLTYQLTVNPDFAQIEADPFDFNISRYESYFSERRPFFTEGNEVFIASGKERGSGFYRPLELFYSRRIGKKLPDGSEVPLIAGTKAFGRADDWEYGGFLAITGEEDYVDDGENFTEEQAYFGTARVKKQIFDNSSIGVLFVGKHDKNNNYGVLDIDGAFRESNWQLAYQFARSFIGSEGDYAASFGFRQFTENWVTLVRGRYIGEDFDISQVGFVPWQGTINSVGLTGPMWYFDSGALRSLMLYGGIGINYEKVDSYTDLYGNLGINLQFRNNWGCELNISAGNSKDEGIKYDSYDINFSSWININPKWHGNLYGGYSRTYNFSREYLAYYTWVGIDFDWQAAPILKIGTSYSMWFEGNPDGEIEDITFNARPYFSLTPINNLNFKVYVDNLYQDSSEKLEQLIVGFLFSYNFSPKSWIYLAFNEVRDREDSYSSNGNLLPAKLRVKNRAGVFKINYLYYF